MDARPCVTARKGERGMNIILADPQDITRAGLMYIISGIDGCQWHYAEDKAELTEQLKKAPDSLVILDYTLFDINDTDELMVIGQRFPLAGLILFSEDLSLDFVRQVIALSQHVSILMKESPLQEIKESIGYALHGQRHICQRMTEMLLTPQPAEEEKIHLTKTESEVLKDIAFGLTTKEIAKKRFSSFHTINTHRKNIFRKLGVNNAHEATRYALRAGMVDSAEYYI